MAEVVTRPQRFAPEEWKLASKVKHKNTERLILECNRLDQEGRGTIERTLVDVNQKLDQRLNHVKNWKGELEKEIDATEIYLTRIEKRLQSLQDNLHIAQTTLANR